MKIDLSDAVIVGTKHSYEQTGIITSKYQIRLDNFSIKADAYRKCMDNSYTI